MSEPVLSLRGPLLIVAQAHPAARYLRSLISADGTLACTEGAGLLPLCDRAVTAWRLVEGRPGPPSALAIRSVRSLVSTMRVVVLSRFGGQEWCEISTASAQAAETFLCLYPHARIACLYCHVSGITDAQARPGGPPATIAESVNGSRIWLKDDELSRCNYWVLSAHAMLAFEQRFAANCRRFRYEDFIDRPHSSLAELQEFFELPGRPRPADGESDLAVPIPDYRPDDQAHPDTRPDELPPELSDEVQRLLAVLDYRA
jgi:hypothetical protein